MDIENVAKIVEKSVHYNSALVIMKGMKSSFPLRAGWFEIEENNLCFTRDDEFIRPPTCIPIKKIKEIHLREPRKCTLDDW